MSDATILVVDDEPKIRDLLKSGLEAEGWRVCVAHDRASLFDVIQHEPVDLVTLDLKLGGEDGLVLARELRRLRNVSILIISGKAEPFERVAGLEAGADDYIVKPFHIREVVLRVQKTLERYRDAVEIPSTVAFDNSIFNRKSNVVRHDDGTEIELTDMELELLELFLRHPGRVLSRDDISNALHGRDWTPMDRSIDVHIARLRRKIKDTGEKPCVIRSVRGVGYVFSGAVAQAEQSS